MFRMSEIIDGVPVIDIVDVGAVGAATTRDGAEPYRALLRTGFARVVAFLPDEAACETLNAAARRGRRSYWPHLVGDGEAHIVYSLDGGPAQSLYEPDRSLAQMFQRMPEAMAAPAPAPVGTRRLDDLPEAAAADLLTVGALGSELAVFAGAPRILSETAVVHVTVALVPLCAGQPLFAEVDQALRRHGFLFHRFAGIEGRTFKPLTYDETGGADETGGGLGQALWAEAVFVKDFMALGGLSAAKLLKLAVILHEVYGSYDFAALALRHFDAMTEGGLWQAYLRRLTGDRVRSDPGAVRR